MKALAGLLLLSAPSLSEDDLTEQAERLLGGEFSSDAVELLVAPGDTGERAPIELPVERALESNVGVFVKGRKSTFREVVSEDSL